MLELKVIYIFTALVAVLASSCICTDVGADSDIGELSTKELRHLLFSTSKLSHQETEDLMKELEARYRSSGLDKKLEKADGLLELINFGQSESDRAKVFDLKPGSFLDRHERYAYSPNIARYLLHEYALIDPSKNFEIQTKQGLRDKLAEASELDDDKFVELIGDLKEKLAAGNPKISDLDSLLRIKADNDAECETLLSIAAYHPFRDIQPVRRYIDRHIKSVVDRCAKQARERMFEVVAGRGDFESSEDLVSLYKLLSKFSGFKLESQVERKALMFLSRGYKFDSIETCVSSLEKLYQAKAKTDASDALETKCVDQMIEQNSKACRTRLAHDFARDLKFLHISTALDSLLNELGQVEAQGIEPKLVEYLARLARKKENVFTTHRKHVKHLRSLFESMVSYPCKLALVYFDSFTEGKAKLNTKLPIDILAGFKHQYVDLCARLTPLLPQIEANLGKVDKRKAGLLNCFSPSVSN